MLWGLLNKLELWRDPEYLKKKEERTARDDRRDILPQCVLQVHVHMYEFDACVILLTCDTILYEVRRRYPSHDREYRDYMSTFNAQE